MVSFADLSTKLANLQRTADENTLASGVPHLAKRFVHLLAGYFLFLLAMLPCTAKVTAYEEELQKLRVQVSCCVFLFHGLVYKFHICMLLAA